MRNRLAWRRQALSIAGISAVLTIAGCGGGGGGDGSGTVTPPPPTTTNVSTTVIDGALRNALVCLDRNVNGQCDASEVQGRTDATGSVTLAVPNEDLGKFPLLAIVGTDAVDTDTGPVTTAYSLTAPADSTSVVSPLTTLVQQTVAATGASTAEAAQTVQSSAGLSVSPLADYTKSAAPTDGSVSAATLARILVVTTQQQAAALNSTVGTQALDGATIRQADVDQVIRSMLIEQLPAAVEAISNPAVTGAVDAAAKEAALRSAADSLVANSGLTPAGVGTAVAVARNATSETVPATPIAGYALRIFDYSDAANWFFRIHTASQAQNTPDANNLVRFVDRRVRSTAGIVAKWGTGADPLRQSDLHWNGSAWVNCPLNFESTSSVRDAQGANRYNFCDSFSVGRSDRATFDISGKTLADVYSQVRAAGYTNLRVTDPTELGSATFPSGSALLFQTVTPFAEAIGYYPGGANSPAGTSNVVTQYSAVVAAGGVAASQAAGEACNSAETLTNGTSTSTLEGLIASKHGTPCVYGQRSFVYQGVTYTSDPVDEWWGNSTVGIGKLGTAPVGTGPAPGFYTPNTLLRVAFTGATADAVTYYACKERFNNGSTRNCRVIGTGTFEIATLGDARVLTLKNSPLLAAPINFNRVFVERGGAVYFGYQNKLAVNRQARLNRVAADALLTHLGVPPEDPEVPLALTDASYQGVWDMRDAASPNNANSGIILFIGNNGTACVDAATGLGFGCGFSVTNPATGAFTFSDLTGVTAEGTLNFLAGTASGTVHDPVDGDTAVVGFRR